MMRVHSAARIGYFGKLPARSDFVKDVQDVPLMGVLDDWLAQVMAELPADPRWKLNYDAFAPVHFAFVGPRRRHAIAGHIMGSRDQSGRRFPFIMMRTLELADPATFAARCPAVLEGLWNSMGRMGRAVMAAADPAPALQAVGEEEVEVDELAGAAVASYMAAGTVAELSGMLGHCNVRRMLLALGLLLQPVLHAGVTDLGKSLVLPLPDNPFARHVVAAFWLELIVPFLGRADAELALFIATLEMRPVLVVGFRGASAPTLRAIIDPIFGAEQQITFDDTDWVDEQLGIDIDIRALASYLDQPQLPLKMARELFLQTFIGGAA